MGKFFNFKRLIKKYSTTFSAITLSKGFYDDEGELVKGEKEITNLTGAIISQSESKVFRSEGALTTKDKQLFMLEPIDDKLHGAKVVYEGNTYNLTNCVDNAKFTGVYVYTLKYVSAFNDTAPDYDLTEKLEQLEKRLDGTVEESEGKIDDTL